MKATSGQQLSSSLPASAVSREAARAPPVARRAVSSTPSGGGFNRFAAEQRALLVNFLLRHTRTREDAEDIAQESLTRLLRYEKARPSLWRPLLFRIARNVAIDEARRKQARHAGQYVELGDAVEDVSSEEAQPDQRVHDEQQLACLRELILALPPRCQEVFLLNRIQGMSFVEIARHLEISCGAVEKHIARALKLLRQGMGDRAARPF